MVVLAGQTLSHYRLIEKVGEGAFGEVWRADDNHLQKSVAIKILRRGLLADDRARERFRSEALILAKLDHPNVAIVHDFDTQDKVDFLVMEFVPGRTLKDSLAAGQFAEEELLRAGLQLAEGLAAAHRRNILHRDIKPGNVRITPGGRVKILDFGLAKELQPATDTSPTETMTAGPVGTLAYMAPEQIWNGQPASARTDVFSLGVVLFEMATGRHPFESQKGVVHSPEDARSTPDTARVEELGVATGLAEVITRALARDPSHRYPSAVELLEDLKRERVLSASQAGPVQRSRSTLPLPRLLLAAAGLVVMALVAYGMGARELGWWPWSTHRLPIQDTAPKKITVLPFENLGQPGDAYFTAGLSEEIANRLVTIGGLVVTSRTSARHYDRADKSIQQLGADLGVDFVVEGAVRWPDPASGSRRLRVTPKLIRVEDDTRIWSATFEHEIEDVFTLQSIIAEGVVRGLNVVVSGEEQRGLETRPTDNQEAYQAYVRGLGYASFEATRDDLELAIDMFERASSLDPNFAAAHAELALSHLTMYSRGHDRTASRLAVAKALAMRALEADQECWRAHSALGFYYYAGERDYRRALEHYSTAVRALPGDPMLQVFVAAISRRAGEWETAAAGFRRAMELDPADGEFPKYLATTLHFLRRYEEAERLLLKSIALAPDLRNSYLFLAANYIAWDGATTRARPVLESAPRQSDPEVVQFRIQVDIYDRRYEAALTRLDSSRIELYRDQWRYSPASLYRCECFTFLGDTRRARTACQAALDELRVAIDESPEDSRIHSAIGWTHALTGNKEEAIREGKLAVDLTPVSQDALDGPFYAMDLAKIYARVGDSRRALDEIERLVSIPSRLSVGSLRVDPHWDPLRGDPRFESLLP